MDSRIWWPTPSPRSFSVTATHGLSSIPVNHAQLESIRASESLAAINELSTYEAFRKRVESNRHDLQTLIKGYRSEGKRVCGIGASTKGNVVIAWRLNFGDGMIYDRDNTDNTACVRAVRSL